MVPGLDVIDSFEIHKFLYDERTRIVLPSISLVTNNLI